MTIITIMMIAIVIMAGWNYMARPRHLPDIWLAIVVEACIVGRLLCAG